VAQSNDAARELYERFGFSVGWRPARYYSNPVEDALVLWREELREIRMADLETPQGLC